MDFSYPVSIDQYRLVVPAPAKESSLFAITRPFQYQVPLINMPLKYFFKNLNSCYNITNFKIERKGLGIFDG